MNTDAPTAFAEIQELYAQTRRSINEYAAHPFGDRRLALAPLPDVEHRGRARKYPADWLSFPADGLTCPVTVWVAVTPRPNKQGVVTEERRRCGEPIDRDDLCAKHADDRDRLAVS